MECKKSATKWNPFLPLAEKHHVAEVTKGGYYGCFQYQHGKVKEIFWVLKIVERWKNWWQITSFEIQAKKRSLASMWTRGS